TRIEKGELRVQIQPLDLIADVINPVLEELKPAAEQRNIKIAGSIPENLPLPGDVTLLRVVYKNLLDNALKYGREGGQIKLGFLEEEHGYRLEVWNEGRGLAKDKLDKLFGKFVRYKTGQDTDRMSTGLGLFITKEVITKHGGTIWAESEEGKWINLIFTLPSGR
ncbi:MAG: HAMP domain-containing histidine kinase, partial [Deltaproteobacteria bacterium]|nr:HAMP domain-containing histidine kinase [Deltaproteobacteria bacterium]